MSEYKVKLNFWLTPAKIRAASKQEAAQKALKLYPTCDCCEQKTIVERVEGESK